MLFMRIATPHAIAMMGKRSASMPSAAYVKVKAAPPALPANVADPVRHELLRQE
jgi:hypothetical protein